MEERALLSVFIWKISSPPRQDLGKSIAENLAREGWPSTHVTKNKFYKEFHREARSWKKGPGLLGAANYVTFGSQKKLKTYILT